MSKSTTPKTSPVPPSTPSPIQEANAKLADLLGVDLKKVRVPEVWTEVGAELAAQEAEAKKAKARELVKSARTLVADFEKAEKEYLKQKANFQNALKKLFGEINRLEGNTDESTDTDSDSPAGE